MRKDGAKKITLGRSLKPWKNPTPSWGGTNMTSKRREKRRRPGAGERTAPGPLLRREGGPSISSPRDFSHHRGAPLDDFREICFKNRYGFRLHYGGKKGGSVNRPRTEPRPYQTPTRSRREETATRWSLEASDEQHDFLRSDKFLWGSKSQSQHARCRRSHDISSGRQIECSPGPAQVSAEGPRKL